MKETYRRRQILVIGFGEDHCTQDAYDLAHRVGREVARKGAVLVTGGLGGVMEASCRGAKEAGGMTVGIVPQEDPSQANPYVDIVICTGMGWTRDFLTAYSCDAVIVVGGGVGTLIEASVAYMKGKPIIALIGSGGVADEVVGRYLDDRKLVKVEGVEEPAKAVEMALALSHAARG